MHRPDFIRLCLGSACCASATSGSSRPPEPVLLQRGLLTPRAIAGWAVTTHGRPGVGARVRHAVRAGIQGIPLVTATVAALAEHEGRDLPYASTARKPGPRRGGSIVGARSPVCADRRDVITAERRSASRLTSSWPWRDTGGVLSRARSGSAARANLGRAGVQELLGLPVVTSCAAGTCWKHWETSGERIYLRKSDRCIPGPAGTGFVDPSARI